MKYRLLAAVIAVLCAASPAFAASSYSSCERLENPVPGDPAVRNAWGTIENTGRSLIDTALAGTISLSVAGSSNVTLTQADGGADQSRNTHYIFTGALTGNITVFWPVYCRAFSVFNNTSGAFTLTVAVTGTPGTTVAVPQGSTMYLVSDGTNISQRIVGSVGGTAGILTLPAGPDTIVGRATTDTLTNKTITSPSIGGTVAGGASYTSPTITGTVGGGASYTAPTFTGNITIPGSGQISSAGLIGIGMVPVNPIDVSDALAGSALGRIYNSSGNVAALAGWQLKNSANSLGGISLTGGSYTTSGVYRQDGVVVDSSGAGGLTFNTTVNQPVYVAVNGVEVARFTANGLSINEGNNTTALIVRGVSSNTVFGFNNAADTGMVYSGPANLTVTAGESAANAMLFLRKDNGTARSINAAGTINASGADYAEWEKLSAGIVRPALGDLVGFDESGAVTDDCAKAVSFGLISTDPSFVGGDKLTAGLKGDALKRREARLIMVAYSGKAPVNFKAGRAGEYIIARCEGKAIKALAMTRAQMSGGDQDNLIGRVRSVLPDGRREVALLH